MNPYSELGVPPTASAADIKAAYRAKAQEAHPDREGGSADAMSRLNQAYGLLRDKRRKARFDATGEDAPLDPDAEAHKLIAEAIMHEAEKDADRDLVRALHAGFASMKREAQAKLKIEQAKHKRVERALKRLRYKGSRLNIMQAALEDKLRILGHACAKYEHALGVLSRILEILKDYDYDWSPAMGKEKIVPQNPFEQLFKVL